MPTNIDPAIVEAAEQAVLDGFHPPSRGGGSWELHMGEVRARLAPLIAAAVVAARAEALREAADAWQQGQWVDGPRYADRIQERIATAQYVTDWLRARAEAMTRPPVVAIPPAEAAPHD